MALNQVVLPGFAAFHIAIAAPKELIKEEEVVDDLAAKESESDEETSEAEEDSE